jgi:predicted CoA-binding protein
MNLVRSKSGSNLDQKNDPPSLEKDSHSDEAMKEILRFRNVAVVGISRDPTKPSYYVAEYLKDHGYHIMPVNPFAQQVLGLKCYKTLLDIEEPVDIVDVFRPSQDVPPIIEMAITKKPKVVWLQEGIHNSKAEEYAMKHGIDVVWNRCMMKEHVRLFGGKPRVSLGRL